VDDPDAARDTLEGRKTNAEATVKGMMGAEANGFRTWTDAEDNRLVELAATNGGVGWVTSQLVSYSWVCAPGL